jgi:YidC/Oxa1 family membrane protein insertase
LELIWNSIWHLLLNILVAINSVVHQPGVAIIIFTILIRLLTVPLSLKSLKSNRNMQAIQPLIKEVQKKYKDDRPKQQEETMKLYQQYGINPAAGCFPLLVQIPVFFALFTALQFTLQGNNPAHIAELQAILWNPEWATAGYANFGTASFLWVPSLAAPDPYYIWPVISGLFQFLQNRMSMPRREPGQAMDTQQRMMNGMMQFMPLYIIFISLNFPAGNVIYWAFSGIFGVVQQYFITGFGTLPDLPFLGWLPRKELPKPVLGLPLAEGAQPKRSMFSKVMARALEAQEAQKLAQQEIAATAGPSEGQPTRPVSSSPNRAERPRDGASTTRVRSSKASEQHIKIVPSGTVKYASDARNKADGNGLSNGSGSTTAGQLPRKKKNKK